MCARQQGAAVGSGAAPEWRLTDYFNTWGRCKHSRSIYFSDTFLAVCLRLQKQQRFKDLHFIQEMRDERAGDFDLAACENALLRGGGTSAVYEWREITFCVAVKGKEDDKI